MKKGKKSGKIAILIGMKKTKFSFFILAPLLLSCANVNGSAITVLGYSLSHNGDLSALDANNLTYADTTYLENDATNLTSLFDEGFSGLFFFTQIGCPRCLEFEKPFCQFVYNHSLLVHRFYYDKNDSGTYLKNVAVFNSYYGVTSFDGATPTLFLGKKGSFVSWARGAVSLSVLENTYSSQVEKKSGLTYFTKEAPFLALRSANPDVPVYFFDSTVTENDAFFEATLLTLGQDSKKTLYAIDLARVDQAEKEAFYKDFSLTSFESLLFSPTQTYHLRNESENAAAQAYLTSYWQ